MTICLSVIIIILSFSVKLSILNAKLNNNCKYFKTYKKCFEGYFRYISELDINTNEPKFINPISKNKLTKFPFYFEIFMYYIKQKNKIGLTYKYYKNNLLIGEYLFLKNYKTKKYNLKNARWYNSKGNIEQINIYFISSGSDDNYSHEFNYYNDFKICIQKTIQFFNSNHELLYQKSETNLNSSKNILGDLEY